MQFHNNIMKNQIKSHFMLQIFIFKMLNESNRQAEY